MSLPVLRRATVIAVLAAAIGYASVAQAQTRSQVQPPADLQQQFDQTFQKMLADPSDLDITFKYAELAIQIGDYEAAISALERMLLFNPNLPRVRLELGVLYFRLGSYAIARTYLTRAIQGDSVPDDVRARVAVFLAEIENRLSPHRFSGSIFAGVRYQNNANAGPERPAITLAGAPAVLGGRFTRKADTNLFGSLNLRHTYDPQLQSGTVWETDGLVYLADQHSQQQLDLFFLEARTGPRADFMTGQISDATVRPYLMMEHVALAGDRYFSGFGGGINFTKQFGAKISSDATAEYRVREYNNTATRPTNELQDGDESEVAVNLRYRLNSNSTFSGGAVVIWERTEVGFNDNQEFTLNAAYSQTYNAPFAVTDEPWTSSLSGAMVITDYHSPDPTVDPNNRRDDQERRVSFLTNVPVNRQFSLVGSVQRTVVSSNFENFSYTNWAWTVGGSYRF